MTTQQNKNYYYLSNHLRWQCNQPLWKWYIMRNQHEKPNRIQNRLRLHPSATMAVCSLGVTPLAATATAPFSTTAFYSAMASGFCTFCFPSVAWFSALLVATNFPFMTWRVEKMAVEIAYQHPNKGKHYWWIPWNRLNNAKLPIHMSL